MSLLSEIEEYKDAWNKSSWKMKFVILLMLIMSTSSLVSLSDTIFEWRGFILDGVEFYQRFIAIPISRFLSRLGLTYTGGAIDSLIILWITTMAVLRVIWFILNQFDDKRFVKKGKVMVIGFIVVAFGLLGYVYEGVEADSFENLYTFVIPGFTFMSLREFWLLKRGRSSKQMFNRIMLNLWGPIIFSILIVLILAAINEGLTRPT